ncbi:ABC transporter substrate-binding protein, partial [Klebsiella pneumoniae]|nr:ABC transporter substrate-binding protein [Klebsiella pneumoniae]
MKKLFISLLSVLSASVASAADFPVTIESCGTPVTFSGPPKRAVINDLNMAEMA